MTRLRSDIRLSIPNLKDLKFICRNMREVDRREIFCCLWHSDPDVLAYHSWAIDKNKIVSYILRALNGDDPVAYLGVHWHTPTSGVAFMFATDQFHRIAAGMSFFIRQQVIPNILAAGLERVECRALKDNKTTCRWLKWLGANAETDLPGFGKNGETFIQFAWRKEDVLFHTKNSGARGDAVAAGANA